MPIYLLALVVQVKPVPQKFSLKRLTVNIVKMVNLVMFVKPVAITEGRLNDVIEIDAASNNGVEEIRDIRDKAKYAPTQSRVQSLYY